MSILAIETSCDDTCAAVVSERGAIRSNVISSQRAHDRFGGVVPEIASRHHLELIDLVVERSLEEAGTTLDEIELIAATQGPGLIGALLVGLSAAKALAAARELPFAAIDHLQGHVAANFLISHSNGRARARGDQRHASGGRARASEGLTRASEGSTRASEDQAHTSADPTESGSTEDGPFEPPFLCLIASGGHTLLADVRDHEGFETLGRTLDDAAGEAFDKGARMLGLGYPGGPALERLASAGDPEAFEFPTSGSRSRGGRGATRAFGRSLDFSFAGLKTSLLYKLRELSEAERHERQADLAASYQAAIVEHLVVRTEEALDHVGLDRLAVGGGVAANGELRRRLRKLGASVHIPPIVLCTDNAAMIAGAACHARALHYPEYLSLDAYATGERPR